MFIFLGSYITQEYRCHCHLVEHSQISISMNLYVCVWMRACLLYQHNPCKSNVSSIIEILNLNCIYMALFSHFILLSTSSNTNFFLYFYFLNSINETSLWKLMQPSPMDTNGFLFLLWIDFKFWNRLVATKRANHSLPSEASNAACILCRWSSIYHTRTVCNSSSRCKYIIWIKNVKKMYMKQANNANRVLMIDWQHWKESNPNATLNFNYSL